MTRAFIETFDALPDAEREEVMRLLRDMLIRRGRGIVPFGQEERLQAIADVFCRNGREVEQLT